MRFSGHMSTTSKIWSQHQTVDEKVERGYIIEKGRIVHEDTMEAIWGDEEVIQKYLDI